MSNRSFMETPVNELLGDPSEDPLPSAEDRLNARVEAYLARSKIPTYSLEEEGKFQLFSAAGERHSQIPLQIFFDGKFCDAVNWAVHHNELYGEFASWAGHKNAGYIKKVNGQPETYTPFAPYS